MRSRNLKISEDARGGIYWRIMNHETYENKLPQNNHLLIVISRHYSCSASNGRYEPLSPPRNAHSRPWKSATTSLMLKRPRGCRVSHTRRARARLQYTNLHPSFTHGRSLPLPPHAQPPRCLVRNPTRSRCAGVISLFTASLDSESKIQTSRPHSTYYSLTRLVAIFVYPSSTLV